MICVFLFKNIASSYEKDVYHKAKIARERKKIYRHAYTNSEKTENNNTSKCMNDISTSNTVYDSSL